MSGPYAPSPGLDLSETRQPNVWVAQILPYVVALITVVLRFTSRRIARKGSWFDDWLIALAMMLATGILAGTCTSIAAGLGLHIWYFPIEEIASHAENILLGLFELDNMYYVCYALAKLSVLAFYYRTFPNRIMRRVVYVLVIVVILWMGVAVTLTVLECSPVQGFWLDPLEAYCPIPRIPLHVGLSAASVATNFIILVLPIPLFLDPEHTALHRFILVLTFGFGLFVCIVSIIRTLAITYTDISSVDLFWNLANVWAWTAVEVQLAIVAANLPTLGHFVARLVPSITSQSLSPAHRETPDPLPRGRRSQRPESEMIENRRSNLNKPLPPLSPDSDPSGPEKGFEIDMPLPEREAVRTVDHGISEWEYVQPSLSPQAQHHAQTQQESPVMGARWDRSMAPSAATAVPRMPFSSTRHPLSVSSPAHTQSSPAHGGGNTNSYASDTALLPGEYLTNRSGSTNPAAGSPGFVHQASPALQPPFVTGRRPVDPAIAALAIREGSHPSQGSDSEESAPYGAPAQRSWYRRGTATTPELDSDEERQTVSYRYSGSAASHAPSYALRLSAYGHGDPQRYSNEMPRSHAHYEAKPPLQPRNPRRVTVSSDEAYRVGASSPETALAKSITVTRVAPSTGNTPHLGQSGFDDFTAPGPSTAGHVDSQHPALPRDHSPSSAESSSLGMQLTIQRHSPTHSQAGSATRERSSSAESQLRFTTTRTVAPSLQPPTLAPEGSIIPRNGEIHVVREVRVDNERWSELRERERVEREQEREARETQL